MYITVTNYKGGVCKTTTAVHIARYLQDLGPTVLIDADPNRSALKAWAGVKGEMEPQEVIEHTRKQMGFAIVPAEEAEYQARNFTHVVKDTEARPGYGDFEKLVRGCDLMVIPVEPAKLEIEALKLQLAAMRKIGSDRYRVLIVKAPPPPQTDADDFRQLLTNAKVPAFKTEIPQLKAFKHAANQGVPVSELGTAQARRAWKAYQSVGKEILNGQSK